MLPSRHLIFFQPSSLTTIMSAISIENRIDAAIGVIHTRVNLSCRQTAREFDVPRGRLKSRLLGHPSRSSMQSLQNKALIDDQELALHKHIVRLDQLALPLRIKSIQATANAFLLQTVNSNPPSTVSKW